MTENEKSFGAVPTLLAGDAPVTSVKKRKRFSTGSLILAVVVLAALGLSAEYMRTQILASATVAPTTTAVVMQLEQRIASLEKQAQKFDERLNELDGRIDKNTAAPVSTESTDEQAASSNATSPLTNNLANTAVVSRLQTDLTALAAALTTLQSEVKQTGSVAAQSQQVEQDTMAAAIAFTELRETAAAGRGFVADLATLRNVAGRNKALQEPLAQLEPYAATGAPTVDALRTEFMRLEDAADVAFDKATAVDWKQRLSADLKGLISIHSVHGDDTPDVFSTTEAALLAGDVPTALNAIKKLPPEAQAVLGAWEKQAEARHAIDTALHNLADRFIQQATAPTNAASEPPSTERPARLPKQDEAP